MGSFKKYALTLCQFYFIASPVLFTKNKKLWNERKEDFFVCIAASAYRVVSKEGENRIMDTIAFLDTHGCMNNPY